MRCHVVAFTLVLAAVWTAGCIDDGPEDRALDYLESFADGASLGSSARIAWAVSAVGEDPTRWPSEHDPVSNGTALPGSGDLLRLGIALGRTQSDIGLTTRQNVREGILNMHSDQGFGSSASILDDALAIQALLAIGIDRPSDDIIHQTTPILLDLQGTDGGWRYNGQGASAADDTGIVLAALRDAGAITESVRADALGYLQGAMGDDGHYLYNGVPNCISTGWAIVAWDALGEAPPPEATSYLLSCQNNDGGFPTIKGNPSELWATTDILQALAVLP